jgi:hypothetical protein
MYEVRIIFSAVLELKYGKTKYRELQYLLSYFL